MSICIWSHTKQHRFNRNQTSDVESKQKKFFPKAEKNKGTKVMSETGKQRRMVSGARAFWQSGFLGTRAHKTATGKNPQLQIESGHSAPKTRVEALNWDTLWWKPETAGAETGRNQQALNRGRKITACTNGPNGLSELVPGSPPNTGGSEAVT